MKLANHRPPVSRRFLRRRQIRCPPLRLTPYAWAKLLVLRDLGETEVGAFGVSRPGGLLLVEDVQLVQQICTPMTVKFQDESIADYFDNQVDAGRKPDEFARIWIHTHPADSPYPSATDEETFARCFGGSDWAVMLIIARGGQTYARLRYHHGPHGDFVLPVKIDFSQDFSGSDREAWKREYRGEVVVERFEPRMTFPIDAGNDLLPWDDLWPTQPDKLHLNAVTNTSSVNWGEICDA